MGARTSEDEGSSLRTNNMTSEYQRYDARGLGDYIMVAITITLMSVGSTIVTE